MGQRRRFLGNIPENFQKTSLWVNNGIAVDCVQNMLRQKEQSGKIPDRLRKIEGKGLRGTEHNIT